VGHAVGQLIPLAVGVALSPLPIIAVILVLTSGGGRVSGSSFLAGWMSALAVLGTAVLLVADEAHASSSGTTAAWVGVLQLVLGILLLGVAAQQWTGRPRGDAEPELPGWMEKVETFTPARAAAVAAGFAAVKPKNLLLTIAAGAAIAESGGGAARQAGAMVFFVVLASVGIAAPVAIHVFMGERAGSILAGMRAWLVRESQTIVAVICLIMAAKLIGDGIGALAS
jgi:hypothetical protein